MFFVRKLDLPKQAKEMSLSGLILTGLVDGKIGRKSLFQPPILGVPVDFPINDFGRFRTFTF